MDGLRRTRPFKRPKKKRVWGNDELWAAFKLSFHGRACVMEGMSVCDGGIEGAHVVPKQRLKRLGFTAAQIYDPLAGMPACTRHHNRHDRWLERIPYGFVPSASVDFYVGLGLLHQLQREFPQVAA